MISDLLLALKLGHEIINFYKKRGTITGLKVEDVLSQGILVELTKKKIDNMVSDAFGPRPGNK